MNFKKKIAILITSVSIFSLTIIGCTSKYSENIKHTKEVIKLDANKINYNKDEIKVAFEKSLSSLIIDSFKTANYLRNSDYNKIHNKAYCIKSLNNIKYVMNTNYKKFETIENRTKSEDAKKLANSAKNTFLNLQDSVDKIISGIKTNDSKQFDKSVASFMNSIENLQYYYKNKRQL